MADRDFFAREARERVAQAVKDIESRTSAEVVVSVARCSQAYRDVDYLVGAALAFVVLLLLVFLPQPFLAQTMPVDMLVAFVLGAWISSGLWGLKRRLIRRRRRDEAVFTAACAAFVRLGISRTSGRTGLLVYLSMLERHVAVVPDIGVDTVALGPAWDQALAAMNTALGHGADFDGFLGALGTLGPLLGQALPRAEDDVNELPDMPDTQP